MRITKEIDYALRIMRCLANNSENDKYDIVDSKTMSDSLGIPPRFTIKILRKLISGGIVKSYKGVNGGYKVAKPLENITMLDIVEIIDEPLTISRCLSDSYKCTRSKEENESLKDLCYFHMIFDDINNQISKVLKNVSLKTVIRNENEKLKKENNITEVENNEKI